MSTPSKPVEINTFVFLDMETTGIPEYELYRTKITEIAFIACTKEHLLTTQKNEVPRALWKLVIPVNPYKMIAPDATRISGLDNYILENVPPFSKDTVKLLHTFMTQLPQPVCFVAHNGNKFDYPILQKSIMSQMEEPLSSELLCLDSLDAFRAIDEFAQLRTESTQSSGVIYSEEIDESIVSIDSGAIELTQLLNVHDILKNEVPQNMQTINESTPCKTKSGSANVNGNVRKRKNKYLHSSANKHQRVLRPRTLFPVKTSQKLSDIYERLFNHCPRVAHQAEADTMVLLKCAVALKEDFVEYAEYNAQYFNAIEPLQLKI